MQETNSSGIILAGMQSSSGKTALTCMVLATLQQRGIPVQSFKVGPDFIDPGYHSVYARCPSINLDSWLMGKQRVLQAVARFGTGSLSVLEGVMGLFDGASPISEEGSTMELARWLNWPIILVVPCRKTGRSVVAAVRGFIEEAGAGKIAGILLNQVNGDGHTHYLRQALAPLSLPLLGAIPYTDLLEWPERHLGLQASAEQALPHPTELAKLGESILDVDALVQLAKWGRTNKAIQVDHALQPAKTAAQQSPRRRIGIARDEAFHFYYQANLDFLQNAGWELVPFSPLHDSQLPSNLHGLIFGGGFPEVFAQQLADNVSLRSAIAQSIQNGMPCYAECGGLMLLTESLITQEGTAYPMCGVIPGHVQMTARLQNFGYCWCRPPAYALPHLSNMALTWRGHEFHYSYWSAESERANLWQVTKKSRQTTRWEGYTKGRLHASYVHLYFPSASELFVELFGESATLYQD